MASPQSEFCWLVAGNVSIFLLTVESNEPHVVEDYFSTARVLSSAYCPIDGNGVQQNGVVKEGSRFVSDRRHLVHEHVGIHTAPDATSRSIPSYDYKQASNLLSAGCEL